MQESATAGLRDPSLHSAPRTMPPPGRRSDDVTSVAFSGRLIVHPPPCMSIGEWMRTGEGPNDVARILPS